ncbi:L-piperidine-6-carboxylate dehydrogenase [Sphingorhabdus sp. M41]|uniref:L-piperidine-6-carboxylate dehydrogenase n=1 Tax=Sphingorhabdus sp. M41 TaxID=1806885 RepID=UPI00078CB8D9|nr:aldehyde dehydrogenase family protein [Sphingorhabdus sp. M41]AMO72341.1 aldehyde dehydrogenase [Sphingorhabdus sp. M41]
MSYPQQISEILNRLGVGADRTGAGDLPVHSPLTGEQIAAVPTSQPAEVEAVVDQAHRAFLQWRTVPAPRRGELVRLFGNALRLHKEDLARLVSIEAGKIPSEGAGEVQEMIDICDFAVGLSRQLYGLTIASERPGHRMMETWHPLGVVGVISAFNFPVAVWAWNTAIALVCGNSVVWKPSEKTPLTAIACQAIFARVAADFDEAPEGLAGLLIGDRDVGEILVDHPQVPLVSATGSTAMGRAVGQRLAGRFAKSILELGGNNACIVAPSADLAMAVRGILFSAVGTAGQRCTSMRRLFVHDDIYDELLAPLKAAYGSISVGDPLAQDALVGPLIDKPAFDGMKDALMQAREQGGIVTGGERHDTGGAGAYYVKPALVEMEEQSAIVCRETFAPILYVMRYQDLDEAIALQNAVGAGLSSAIFTLNMREAEQFLSAAGSDCGIANVNIGTSGAEIGGAFGGEKETGGGRESGSDAWKAYMRRATNTINYSADLPLAQGVNFDF